MDELLLWVIVVSLGGLALLGGLWVVLWLLWVRRLQEKKLTKLLDSLTGLLDAEAQAVEKREADQTSVLRRNVTVTRGFRSGRGAKP